MVPFHSLHSSLLRAYSLPGTGKGVGGSAVNEKAKMLSPHGANILVWGDSH